MTLFSRGSSRPRSRTGGTLLRTSHRLLTRPRKARPSAKFKWPTLQRSFLESVRPGGSPLVFFPEFKWPKRALLRTSMKCECPRRALMPSVQRERSGRDLVWPSVGAGPKAQGPREALLRHSLWFLGQREKSLAGVEMPRRALQCSPPELEWAGGCLLLVS